MVLFERLSEVKQWLNHLETCALHPLLCCQFSDHLPSEPPLLGLRASGGSSTMVGSDTIQPTNTIRWLLRLRQKLNSWDTSFFVLKVAELTGQKLSSYCLLMSKAQFALQTRMAWCGFARIIISIYGGHFALNACLVATTESE